MHDYQQQNIRIVRQRVRGMEKTERECLYEMLRSGPLLAPIIAACGYAKDNWPHCMDVESAHG